MQLPGGAVQMALWKEETGNNLMWVELLYGMHMFSVKLINLQFIHILYNFIQLPYLYITWATMSLPRIMATLICPSKGP